MEALETRKREANMLFQQEQYVEAVQVYSSLIEMLQGNGVAGEAAESLESAVRLNRAWAWIQMPRDEDALAAAEEDCSAVIAMDPSYLKAYFRRALTREHRGLQQLAMEDAIMAKQLEPGNPSVGVLLERLQRCSQDDNDIAMKLHQLAISKDSHHKDARAATSSVVVTDKAAAAWRALQADEKNMQKVYHTTTEPRRKPRRVLKTKKITQSGGSMKDEISEKTDDLWASLRREEATTVAKAFSRSKGARPVG